jgi:Doubled CXXCH motif (Paired_CXXCH_1)
VKLTRQQWITGVLACATTLLVATIAQSQTPTVGIYTTKHNLGNTSTAGNNRTTSTEEVCVFCHTPHGADNSFPASPPLWNKSIPTGATYTPYNTAFSSSIDGQVLAAGSVSVACLSCHDGTQAMDNIINSTGSGNYDPTGGGADGLGYSWAGSPRIDAGGAGRLTGLANLTNDLTNDHPIGIEYCGGGLSGTVPNVAAGAAAGACRDADFRQPRSATINGSGVWWVETGTADNTRTRTDMILFTRGFTGGNGPSVECASCHDPHVSPGQTGPNSQVAGATFLRVANTGSAICLACHIK